MTTIQNCKIFLLMYNFAGRWRFWRFILAFCGWLCVPWSFLFIARWLPEHLQLCPFCSPRGLAVDRMVIRLGSRGYKMLCRAFHSPLPVVSVLPCDRFVSCITLDLSKEERNEGWGSRLRGRSMPRH